MRGLAIVALTFLLAGCLGGGPGPTDDARDAVQDPVASVDVPEWDVGMHWTYDMSFGTTQTIVVTAKDSGAYTTDTDSEDVAFFHAQEEISTIGRIRASDLAGEQDGQKVKFFDFPLEDGKAWQATLDGNAYDVEAHAQDDGKWHMMMRQDGTTRVVYSYDPQVAWFAWIQYNDETGAEAFRMDLASHGDGYTGDVVRMALETVLEHDIQGTDARTGQVPLPEADDLYLILNATCAAGAQQFAIGPASSAPSLATGAAAPGEAFQHACPDDVVLERVIAEGPQEEWSWLYNAADPDARIEFRLLARTVERIPMA